ncbi:MAG TPA: hypothetical protein VH500_16405 [Nitrososphaeraceae archaeon]|jgi:hypothetical protein
MSESINEKEAKEGSSQWPDLMAQLFDRLTGKGTKITYEFQDLVIDIPRATGPQGQDLGSAKWTVNGKIVITAQAHNTD